MPAVSVLVPCYNVEKYIRQCLDSVVGQTLADMEIICLNDGSTDGTLAILQEYAAKDSRVRIIDKPNSGYGDSMNKGLEAATGEYIGIVESDDWAEADMFESLYALAKQHDCDMVKSNYFDYRGGESTLVEVLPEESLHQVLTPRERTEIFFKSTYIWTDLFRREWLNRCKIRFQPTPGASYQDIGFNFKTLACAERAFFIKRAFLHYRRDNEASSVNNRGKTYCVCDEYSEIERFISKDKSLSPLLSIAIYRKYHVYYWNFRRLRMPSDYEFCMRGSKEFREDFTRGRVEEKLFKPKHYRRLRRWAFHPWLFILDELFSSNGRKKLMQALRGEK